MKPYYVSLLIQCGCGRTQCGHDCVIIYGPYQTEDDAKKVERYLF